MLLVALRFTYILVVRRQQFSQMLKFSWTQYGRRPDAVDGMLKSKNQPHIFWPQLRSNLPLDIA